MAKQEVVVIYNRKRLLQNVAKGKSKYESISAGLRGNIFLLVTVAPDELENFVSSSKVLAIKEKM